MKSKKEEVEAYEEAVKAKAKLRSMMASSKMTSKEIKSFKTRRRIKIPEIGDFTWFCLRITRMLEWYGIMNVLNLVYMQFAIFSLL